jgi:predicted amidophosphoribosyltransferase
MDQQGDVMAGKLEREKVTILKMVKIYCARFHKPDGELCAECQDLAEYAVECVMRCRYGEDKPACGLCPTNCFSGDSYTRIAAIMRYAGPRMLYKHPLLAFSHIYDAVRRRA